MGVFDIGILCPHGRVICGQTRRNHLMWRSHDRVLRKILPSPSGALTFEMGFSGPMFRGPYERPNYDHDAFTFDRRLGIDDVTGAWANEGGTYSDQIRELFDYARQPVTWSVTRDKFGALISTGWVSWTNRVTWMRHGDWSPDPQPSLWTDCPRDEHQDHGFPWCTPRIHPNWWTDNVWEVNCEDCQGHTPWSISHYPVGLAFVIVKKVGGPDELLAAATFTGPTHFRMGGRILCRYRGRFG